MNQSISHIAFALAVMAASANYVFADGVDISNRCSLTDTKAICSWACGGFEPVFPAGEAAEKWRTFEQDLDTPVDLSLTPVIAYNLLVPAGPGRDFDTRLTLVSSTGERFSATAHIIPTLWQGVCFDMHSCTFLNDIASIEIAIRNLSDKPWDKARFSVDKVVAGKPLDLDFEVYGSAERFHTEGKAAVSGVNGCAKIDFDKGDKVRIETAGSRNRIYNPELTKRNTVAVTMTNLSNADSLRLYIDTDRGTTVSKAMPMPKTAEQVLFNFSDIADASGRIEAITLEPTGGKGSIIIDRISFENESPICTYAGRVSSCTATKDFVTVRGEVDSKFLGNDATIEIRHYPFWQTATPFDSLELLSRIPAGREFKTSDIPNRRLDGRMSHLSSRFIAALRTNDGSVIPLDEPFFISNWRDFITNPYSFETSDAEFRVQEYGAVGDGVTNDNAAIQRAIDAASAAGGGKVILGGGRTYIATNLELHRGVNLVIETGAVLRQSPLFAHYTEYPPEYGHDNVIPDIPWTHCMYTNRPLILAKDTDHVKITGGGKIRMDDVYSENPLWNHYARVCSDRIHIVPIAVCNTRNVEISDIDIVRCNNYHTIFYRADSVFIGNLKMYEVACLSGDGLSFGNAVTNVRVGRCVFESNDDGIVLCSSYKDPRGGVWRQRVDSIDSSVRHIEVLGSYIDSSRGGAGKAIALIPWGSTNPRQDYSEIDNIEVRDCVLRGGHSVGSWSDNPFDGKPFDNTERDDYAPVKNLRILGNEYLSALDLNGVVPTTLITDCGLKGSNTFKNSDFNDRMAYWSANGSVSAAQQGSIGLIDAWLYQGLHLEPGEYTMSWQGSGKVKPYVADINGKRIKVSRDGRFSLKSPATVLVGVKGKNAIINSIEIK